MNFKIIQYGCGKMSKYTMRYVIEKGWQIIGAFDINPDIVGQDISKIMETPDKTNITVEHANSFETFLKENKVDAVIVTTMSLFKDIYNSLEICAKYGVNAITTCEEAFFPQNSNPTLYNNLDALCKKTNCTITGSGYQDIYWGNLIASIAGSTHKITKIKGTSSYNVEDYGIALAKAHGAGLTMDEFDDQIASVDRISDNERYELINNGEYQPSYMWNVNGWIAEKLGLEITHQSQKCIPQIAKRDIYSTTLNMTIKQGQPTGMSAVVTSLTKQGIIIETQCVGKVYDSDDYDQNIWTLEGEPTTAITVNNPNTVELTCSTIVNRIPDIISAPAGYFTTNKFNLPKYLNNNINLK